MYGVCVYMLVMLLVEMSFVLQDHVLPLTLFPTTTPHEIVSTCHRLFPAFMSGSRSIVSAFHVEPKDRRIELFQPVLLTLKSNLTLVYSIVQKQIDNIENKLLFQQLNSLGPKGILTDSIRHKLTGEGIMHRAERMAETRADLNTHKIIQDKLILINNSKKLHKNDKIESIWSVLRNFVLYYMVRIMILKFSTKDAATSGVE